MSFDNLIEKNFVNRMLNRVGFVSVRGCELQLIKITI